MSKSSICIVIPARLHSTRLPRKMLLRAGGISLLEHTFRRAQRAELGEVLVATADGEIAEEVSRFGGRVAWTSADAQSGTDRVIEVAARDPGPRIFVNLQGDEPEMPSEYLRQVATMLEQQPLADISTLAAPRYVDDPCGTDPACVKVVINHRGDALYFSRAPIPFIRDPDKLEARDGHFLQHLGLYAYRREFLMQAARLNRSRLEQAEQLEQLRFLEAGYRIAVGQVPVATRGIDTPDDFEAFKNRIDRT